MHPLPSHIVNVILADMDDGKIGAMAEMIRRTCGPDARVLYVSHSNALCAGAAAELSAQTHLTFVNHQDPQGPTIQDICVVVCLDSTNRVGPRNFDVVIVDEAAAVAVPAKFEERTGLGTNLFRLLVLLATRVYFLDGAEADRTPIASIANYVASSKRTEPYWVQKRVACDSLDQVTIEDSQHS
jgi:hypothetical protein